MKDNSPTLKTLSPFPIFSQDVGKILSLKHEIGEFSQRNFLVQLPREKESTDFENQTSFNNFMKDFSN